MRSFVILFALCGAAFARPNPDVSLGYKYDVGNNQNYQGPGPLGGGYSYDGQSTGLDAVNSAQILASLAVPENKVTTVHKHKTTHVKLEPVVTKHFYFHAAPEEHEEVSETREVHLGRPEKHYRVVFIKAPEYHQSAAQLKAHYPTREEKTVIYVLSKKPEALDVGDLATPAPQVPSKPEVFFIKYKTPEEAAHAQKKIQEGYDIINGETKVSNEGISQITSVIGSLGDHVRYGSTYTETGEGLLSEQIGAGSRPGATDTVYVQENKVDPGAAYLPQN